MSLEIESGSPLRDFARKAWETAEEKGWHEGGIHVPEKIALIHAEASEALEDYRDSLMTGWNDEKPVGFDSELADIIIRVFDLALALDIDIEDALIRKMQYNETRPYRHGGKKA